MSYYLIKKDTEEASKGVDNIQYSLLYQYTHITREKASIVHDDRLDALAIALEYVKAMVMIDPEEALKAVEEAEMEKFLNEKIYSNYTPKIANYLDNF